MRRRLARARHVTQTLARHLDAPVLPDVTTHTRRHHHISQAIHNSNDPWAVRSNGPTTAYLMLINRERLKLPIYPPSLAGVRYYAAFVPDRQYFSNEPKRYRERLSTFQTFPVLVVPDSNKLTRRREQSDLKRYPGPLSPRAS